MLLTPSLATKNYAMNRDQTACKGQTRWQGLQVVPTAAEANIAWLSMMIAVASWGEVGCIPIELQCFLWGAVPWAFGSKIRISTQGRRRNLGTGTEGVEQGGKTEGLLREGTGPLGTSDMSWSVLYLPSNPKVCIGQPCPGCQGHGGNGRGRLAKEGQAVEKFTGAAGTGPVGMS